MEKSDTQMVYGLWDRRFRLIYTIYYTIIEMAIQFCTLYFSGRTINKAILTGLFGRQFES